MKRTLLVAVAISLTGLVGQAADNEKKQEGPRREGLLEKYDKNKNGKLDEDEREALRKDRVAERTKRFDKNGDGKIDEEEARAARSEFRKRRGEAPPAKQPEQKKDAPAPAK